MPLHCSLLMSFLKEIQNWTQTLDVFWEVLSRAIYHFSHPPDCISVNTEQDAVDLLCPQCTPLGSMHLDSTAHQDLQIFFIGADSQPVGFQPPACTVASSSFPDDGLLLPFQNVPVVSSTYRSPLDGIPTFKTYWLVLPSLQFCICKFDKSTS